LTLVQNTAFNAETAVHNYEISGNALKQGVEHTQCCVSAVHNCKNIRLRLRIKTVE